MHSVIGEREMKDALAEAVMSYNCDVNDSGHSPIQVVTGRQPRMHGDVLGGIQQRLSERSLISASPSMARTLAMRETARLAMVRLHFSRGLRRAELSRSRNPTMHDLPSPGEIVYFYRFQKYQGKNHAKKVLALRQWHGPALLLAIEGNSIAFVSYKNQLHRCALEHIGRASSLEQISAGSWHDAIAEVIEQALREQVGKIESKNEKLLDKQPDVGGQVFVKKHLNLRKLKVEICHLLIQLNLWRPFNPWKASLMEVVSFQEGRHCFQVQLAGSEVVVQFQWP